MRDAFSAFTPRIIFKKSGSFYFRVQKRSRDRELLIGYQKILSKHDIYCSVISTRNGKYLYYLLQINSDSVFRFLKLVNNFRGGEQWKQICAKRIHTLAVMRKEFR